MTRTACGTHPLPLAFRPLSAFFSRSRVPVCSAPFPPSSQLLVPLLAPSRRLFPPSSDLSLLDPTPCLSTSRFLRLLLRQLSPLPSLPRLSTPLLLKLTKPPIRPTFPATPRRSSPFRLSFRSPTPPIPQIRLAGFSDAHCLSADALAFIAVLFPADLLCFPTALLCVLLLAGAPSRQ